jgi:hypothetical protein
MLLIHTEEDLLRAVREDPWMMNILSAARALMLPDSWVCAGFVRSKVWDVQHGFTERTPLADIDVIYYDSSDIREETEKAWEAQLRAADPSIPWSVKNQARMHVVNDIPPYTSSVDGMSKFPETATALGLSLDEHGNLRLAAPHGIRDVIQMELRPTPSFITNRQLHSIYEKRIASKNWRLLWPRVQITAVGQLAQEDRNTW